MLRRVEEKMVSLNVGGQRYATTWSTLRRFHSEALLQMLSNPDEDGNFFLDRDGKMFQYILGFLRNQKLCLPSDFSEFDSLTTEVNYFNISTLSQCLEKIKQEKLNVRYLEILETSHKDRGGVTISLKGKQEDLKELPLILVMSEKYKLENAENSSYVEIMSFDENARLLLAEHLTVNGWTCETSDFSSSSYVCDDVMYSEKNYRDLWKK